MPVLAVLAALAIVAVARAGRLGRVVTVVIVSAAFVSGLGVSTLYASRFAEVAVGLEAEETFLRRTAPYHDAAEWANRNLPADAHVLSDPRAALAPRASLGDVDAVRPARAAPAPAATKAFVREHGLTHALVFETNVPHVRQAQLAGGRVVGRVTARTVTSRTLGELGPPETVLVYSPRPDRGVAPASGHQRADLRRGGAAIPTPPCSSASASAIAASTVGRSLYTGIRMESRAHDGARQRSDPGRHLNRRHAEAGGESKFKPLPSSCACRGFRPCLSWSGDEIVHRLSGRTRASNGGQRTSSNSSLNWRNARKR